MGHRSVSKFAIELANPLLNDFCLNFVDHISPELDICIILSLPCGDQNERNPIVKDWKSSLTISAKPVGAAYQPWIRRIVT
jgi:hypothetical protein